MESMNSFMVGKTDLTQEEDTGQSFVGRGWKWLGDRERIPEGRVELEFQSGVEEQPQRRWQRRRPEVPPPPQLGWCRGEALAGRVPV